MAAETSVFHLFSDEQEIGPTQEGDEEVEERDGVAEVSRRVGDHLDKHVHAEEEEGDEVDPEGGDGPLPRGAEVGGRHRAAARPDTHRLKDLVLPVVPGGDSDERVTRREDEGVGRTRRGDEGEDKFKKPLAQLCPHLTLAIPDCRILAILFN